MARLGIGVAVGIALSIISVALFTAWGTMRNVTRAMELASTIEGITLLLSLNFEYRVTDALGPSGFNIYLLFAPTLLGWLLVGYVSGTIAKGAKRGLMAGALVVVIDLLVWILLSVISGEDLMALFQGAQLISTLGGILGGLGGAVATGLIGGIISGPYEEFY